VFSLRIHMPITVIRISPGIGKTTEAAREIAHYKNIVEVYTVTRKLAKEWESLILEYNPQKRVQIISGRSQEVSEGLHYCKKHKLAEELTKAGCSVYPNLCQKSVGQNQPPNCCKHFSSCAYIQQFGRADVYIYVHAHLGRQRSRLEQWTPKLVVIDESFWTSCVQTLRFKIDQLRHPGLPDETIALCSELAFALAQHQNSIPELINAADANGTLLRAMRALQKASTIASPEMTDREIRKRIKTALPLASIRVMLQQLRVESQFDRPIQSVTYCANTGDVEVHQRMNISRFSGQGLRRVLGPTAKLLLLDASADEMIIKQFFDVDNFVEISVKLNAHVTQCYSTACPTSRLVPGSTADSARINEAARHVSDIQEIIDRHAGIYEKVFVVGPSSVTGNERKNLEPILHISDNVDFAHFSAIRGVDIYKDHDAAVIIGRNQPPVNEIENLGRAIYFDQPDPLNLSGTLAYETRGYCLTDCERGVSVQVMPDPRLQAIMEQLRECETEQAISRLRLVHHQGKPKQITVISNLPLDMEVAELRDMREMTQGGTRLEQAFNRQADGVLPLNAKWLAENYPDLWPTEAAAKKDMGRRKGQTSNINIIRTMSPFEFQYKPSRQRKWSRCLSRFDDHEIIAKTLTIAQGEVITAKPVPTVNETQKTA